MSRILQSGLTFESVSKTQKQLANASQRISTAFLELLEQQFPTGRQQPIRLRTASQFADNLNIHVNHLNRALKVALNKTTTQAISERILQEAKILLRNSNLSIADIAYVLGFTEATHFNNFFRKHTQISPTKFRTGDYANSVEREGRHFISCFSNVTCNLGFQTVVK